MNKAAIHRIQLEKGRHFMQNSSLLNNKLKIGIYEGKLFVASITHFVGEQKQSYYIDFNDPKRVRIIKDVLEKAKTKSRKSKAGTQQHYEPIVPVTKIF